MYVFVLYFQQPKCSFILKLSNYATMMFAQFPYVIGHSKTCCNKYQAFASVSLSIRFVIAQQCDKIATDAFSEEPLH